MPLKVKLDKRAKLSSSFTAWLVIELIHLNKAKGGFIPQDEFLAHMLEQLNAQQERYPLSADLSDLLEEKGIDPWDKEILRFYIREKIEFLKLVEFVECDKAGRLLATSRAKKRFPDIEDLMNQFHGSTCSGEFADEPIIRRSIEQRLKRDEINVSCKIDSQLTARHTMEDYISSLATLKQCAVTFENTVASLTPSFENKKQLLFADHTARKLLVCVTRSLGLESKYAEGLDTEGKDIPMLHNIEILPGIAKFRQSIDDFLPKFQEAVKTQESYSITTLASRTFHIVQDKLKEVFKVEDQAATLNFYMGSNTKNPGVQWTAKGHAKTSGLGGSPGRPRKDSHSSKLTARNEQLDCDVVTPSR